MNKKNIFLSLFYFLNILIKEILPALIGIDIGSEFIKVSLKAPGKPFFIIENTTTKRKTENCV